MKSILIALASIAVFGFSGCFTREELATRLAKEREVEIAKSPPSDAEFRDAAMRGDKVVVSDMIERNVDVDAVDENGRTALQLAAFDGFDEVVQVLLKNGADPRRIDGMGRTALMFASTGPHVKAVDLLLQANSPIDAVDKDEQFTAIMFAAAEGQLEVVESLLRAGANPDLRDVDSETALDFATSNGHEKVANLLRSVMKP